MTQATKINILLIALIISIGLNIYEVIILKSCMTTCFEVKASGVNDSSDTGSAQPSHALAWSFCENEGRFDENHTMKGGREMDEDSAKTKVLIYREAHRNDPKKTTGFIFSKLVFDHIFNDPDTKKNMVRFDLIVDDDKTLKLIAKGISRIYTDISYNETNSTRVFINQSMCPTDCKNLVDWD